MAGVMTPERKHELSLALQAGDSYAGFCFKQSQRSRKAVAVMRARGFPNLARAWEANRARALARKLGRPVPPLPAPRQPPQSAVQLRALLTFIGAFQLPLPRCCGEHPVHAYGAGGRCGCVCHPARAWLEVLELFGPQRVRAKKAHAQSGENC